jgi:hypothetical protein
MSLINDALKKAQRLRTEDAAGPAPPMPGGGGGRVAKRGEPRTPQQLVLIAAGVVALVVLTVVATVWLINRPTAPKPEPVAASPATKPAVNVSTPPPIIVAPLITPEPEPVAAVPATTAPKPKPTVPPGAAPRATVPAPAVAQSKPPPPATVVPAAVTETPAVAATEPPPAAPAPPAGPPQPNEKIHAFVDAIRVTAIRSAGDDSRVQMNDRVFRVNDIVDRSLGLRLTKVEQNILTFTDANGATYVKNF